MPRLEEKQSAYERRKDAREFRLMNEFKKEPHARLMAYLRDPDSLKRSVAVMELHRRNTKAALRDAMRLCRSKDPILRENAALVLGQLKIADAATAQKVVELLYAMSTEDPKAIARAGAMCALGHRAWLGADPAVVLAAADKGSRDTSSSVRTYAAIALVSRS